jgi:hypothetical protein
MKRALIDIALCCLVIAVCGVVGFLTGRPSHEIAIWGLIGWLISGRDGRKESKS